MIVMFGVTKKISGSIDFINPEDSNSGTEVKAVNPEPISATETEASEAPLVSANQPQGGGDDADSNDAQIVDDGAADSKPKDQGEGSAVSVHSDANQSLSEEDAISLLKSKGFNISSKEEAAASQSVSDPYEGMSEETAAFVKSGMTVDEWSRFNRDLSKLSDEQLAIERVKSETPMDISDEQAKLLVYDSLGLLVDGSLPDELTDIQELRLASYASKYKSDLEKSKADLAAQKSHNNQSVQDTKEPVDQVELIELEDGTRLTREKFDALSAQREQYKEQIEAAVEKITASNFSFSFNEDGEKKEFDGSYDFSPEDKHRMLSDARDVSKVIKDRYESELGFNHESFAEDVWWMDKANRQKALSAMLGSARSQAKDEVLSLRNNTSIVSRPQRQISNEGERIAIPGRRVGMNRKIV